MRYLNVIIHIESRYIDTLSDYLFYLGCEGVEVKDSQTFLEEHNDHFGELYSLNEDDYPNKGAIISAFFDDTYDLAQLKDDIIHIITNNGISIIDDLFKIDIVDFDENDETWKDYHQEIIINEGISIIPSWFETKKDGTTIKIDPGLGFGTGKHPTTKMCLQLLSQYIKENDSVIDVGTGSGIIAILAAKLTNGQVFGIDLDYKALENARYNATLNDASEIILSQDYEEINQPVDIIVMNIVYSIIITLLDDIVKYLKTNGLIILSGIQYDQQDLIIEELKKRQLNIVEVKEEDGFIALVCSR